MNPLDETIKNKGVSKGFVKWSFPNPLLDSESLKIILKNCPLEV